jgi:hypothetical protein
MLIVHSQCVVCLSIRLCSECYALLCALSSLQSVLLAHGVMLRVLYALLNVLCSSQCVVFCAVCCALLSVLCSALCVALCSVCCVLRCMLCSAQCVICYALLSVIIPCRYWDFSFKIEECAIVPVVPHPYMTMQPISSKFSLFLINNSVISP